VAQQSDSEKKQEPDDLQALLPHLSLDGPRFAIHERNGFVSEAMPRKPMAANEADTNPVEPEVAQLLQAIADLQAKVRWHQEQCAGHQAAVTQYRVILAQHGIRLKAITQAAQTEEKVGKAGA